MAVSTWDRAWPLDARIEKRVDRVGLDIAAGNDAREQFGDLVALRDRQRARRAALVEPVAPSAAGRRIFDAEEEAAIQINLKCPRVDRKVALQLSCHSRSGGSGPMAQATR